ncbi:hypothetical protein RBH29_02855 [Herbivorax sp. ANBcel31]|uniref:phage late control D family protein n=1 Tax=Herbivorax sp. ANBcel31 TaxID=3069754 RepID=UPI0027ADB455|nr:hypothetical protein [Herbivorax sp. ANBcel31]MDQ2085378.1 hypothetical protein [Herbivorax sp. ANBcel31]
MTQKNLMSSEKYKYSDLKKHYMDFSVPTFKILINNNDPVEKERVVINDINIELTVGYEASACSFSVLNIYDKVARRFKKELMDKYFDLGKIVEVQVGYIKTVKVFKGYISEISADFSDDVPAIHIRCMDVKGAMMNNRLSQVTSEKNVGKVVEALIKKYSVLCKNNEIKVDKLADREDYVEISSKSDYEFIKKSAEELNWEFFVFQGIVYFRKPKKITPPVINLEWGVNLLSFSREIGLMGQVSEVIVRSSNELQKDIFESKAKKTIKLGKSGESVIKDVKTLIVDQSIKSQKEADIRAKAELEKIGENLGSGKGKCIGLPEIVPGRFIQLSKMGEGINGNYYIAKVTHNIGSRGFITSFDVGVDNL